MTRATDSEDELRRLTLDLLSPVRCVTQAQVDALPDRDWDTILRISRHHRVAPLLHWQLERANSDLQLPRRVSDALDDQLREATLRALAVQRELVRVHDVLESADIPHVALKGAALATSVYPHPALRPLRDLDILVPPDRMDEARSALLAGGLRTIAQFERIPRSITDRMQHSAPLRCGDTIVELHRRVLQLRHDHRAGDDLTDDPDFWPRCVDIRVAGAQIAVPCATDLALHLIVHAMYDHRLSNGPLVLSDLGFLAQAGRIDWDALESRMDRMGYGRGLLLVRSLMQRFWGGFGPRQADRASALPDDLDGMCHEAALLMLHEGVANTDAMVLRALRSAPTVTARLAVAASMVFPSRAIVASVLPVREDSPWIALWYPAWWLRQARKRLRPLRDGRRPRLMMDGADRIAALDAWLDPGRTVTRSPLRR